MGNKLRQWRNQKNLSAEQLAEMIGYSKQYIYEIEKGRKRLNEDFIRAMYKVYPDMDVCYLLGLNENIIKGDDLPKNLKDDGVTKVVLSENVKISDLTVADLLEILKLGKE